MESGLFKMVIAGCLAIVFYLMTQKKKDENEDVLLTYPFELKALTYIISSPEEIL